MTCRIERNGTVKGDLARDMNCKNKRRNKLIQNRIIKKQSHPPQNESLTSENIVYAKSISAVREHQMSSDVLLSVFNISVSQINTHSLISSSGTVSLISQD